MLCKTSTINKHHNFAIVAKSERVNATLDHVNSVLHAIPNYAEIRSQE
jgi:hypothetical protein